MKTSLFAFLFLLLPLLCISQSSSIDRKIFLDSSWNETTSENYKYYRIIKDYYSDKELYVINDYYKNGVLQMEGTSRTKEGESKMGEFIFYYENGNKKSVSNFVKGRPNGKESEWYENGNKKLEGEYIEDKKKFTAELKISQFWNSKNVQTLIDGNGDYEEVGENSFASGKVKNGFKDGNWQGYNKKIGYTFSENYENQKLISGVSIDSSKVSHNYKVIEIKPEPKKGLEHFYKFIGRNLNVPNNPKNISGKVILKFTIDKEGKIVEPKIIKSLGYGVDEEAIRVLMIYPDWFPGEQRGRKVRCTYSIPITITPN